MSARRIIAIAAAGAVVAGGTGAAIAAVSSKDDRAKAEQEVLDNAAKRLSVTPQKLRDALSAAQDDQLDKAVQNGDLTRKQADAIKQARKRSGAVLGFGGMGPGLHGKHHGRPIVGLFSDLARALGVSDRELMTKLRDGKSIADIAKAQGKSLDSVRSAVKASVKERVDKAVKDGDLTRKQADALREHLDEHLDHLGKAPHLRFRGHDRFRNAPLPPGARPGRFVPAPDGPPAIEGPPSTS